MLYSPAQTTTPNSSMRYPLYLESGTPSGSLGWWLALWDSNHVYIQSVPTPNPSAGGWVFQYTTYTVPSGVAYVALYAQVYLPTASIVLRVDDGFVYDSSSSLSVAQNLDYFPYGELNSSDSGITIHKFTGDEQDSETGLDHTQFRQYSAVMARWMTADPADLAAADPSNPQSWNRYEYVLNNPLAYVDPLGLTITCSWTTIISTGENPPGETCTDNESGNTTNCVSDGSQGCIVVLFSYGPVTLGGGPASGGQQISGGGGGAGGLLRRILNRTKTVNSCAGQLSQAGSVSNITNGLVPEVLGSNTFGDIATLATGGGGLDQGTALAFDGTLHASPWLSGNITVGTTTVIKAVSNIRIPGVYNPVTAVTTARTVAMTEVGHALLDAAEDLFTGKVLVDAGVYVGALVVCSQD